MSSSSLYRCQARRDGIMCKVPLSWHPTHTASLVVSRGPAACLRIASSMANSCDLYGRAIVSIGSSTLFKYNYSRRRASRSFDNRQSSIFGGRGKVTLATMTLYITAMTGSWRVLGSNSQHELWRSYLRCLLAFTVLGYRSQWWEIILYRKIRCPPIYRHFSWSHCLRNPTSSYSLPLATTWFQITKVLCFGGLVAAEWSFRIPHTHVRCRTPCALHQHITAGCLTNAHIHDIYHSNT